MRETGKKEHLGIWIGAAAVLAAAIILLCIPIQTITVTGSSRYSSQQIQELLFPSRWDRNPLICYLRDRFQPHRQIPFVQDYEIAFVSPFHVEVIVYEKSIVGYVSSMSSYMYFDKDGIIVESSGSRLEDVPQITGLKFSQLILYRPLPVQDPGVFQQILNLTQQLQVYDLQVNEISYDSSSNATLHMGELEVSLGNGENVDSKISVLSDILRDNPSLLERKGVLELSNYEDSGLDETITFQPK